MKLRRNWRLVFILVLGALLMVQMPGIAQALNLPWLWTGYLPVIQSAPSPTPTPTFTPTPTPTATPTNTPLPPGTPPAYSSSYYLLTVDGNKMYNLGCQIGTQDRDTAGVRDQMIVLDFGSPKLINAEFGTDLFWMGPATITQIKSAVENFGRGYYICASTDRGSQIYVVVGTTNYPLPSQSFSAATWRAHGVAWSQMINDINAWYVASGYSAQVHALGGTDIELAWNSPTNTRAWVDGYDSVDKYDFYNFGTADGCATRANPTSTTCAGAWTQEDAWYVAYGTRPGFPLPEIYNTRGVNAEQWAILSQYSVKKHNYPIEFHGVLTQYQACQDKPAECVGVNNSPSTGWLQLYNELKRDPATFYTPRWSTDILWANTMPAGPLAALADRAPVVNPTPMAQQSVESLTAALTQKGMEAQMRLSLQAKLANAQRLVADTAQGQARPAVKNPDKAPEAEILGDSGFPVGIFDGMGGVIHSWEGTITNHWQDSIGTDFVLVSAGAQADDPTQGLVVVMRVSGDRTRFSRQFYLTPQKAGAVRVLEQSGSDLLLSAANGQQFRFNPATSQFSR